MKNKLKLNKKTVSELSTAELDSVKGGFTYSLSLGEVCRKSKELGATNAYDCGDRQYRIDSGIQDIQYN